MGIYGAFSKDIVKGICWGIPIEIFELSCIFLSCSDMIIFKNER